MADISPRWYAAYTASRHEKSVFTQLNGKQIEVFLPLCRTVRRWKNRSTSTLELPCSQATCLYAFRGVAELMSFPRPEFCRSLDRPANRGPCPILKLRLYAPALLNATQNLIPTWSWGRPCVSTAGHWLGWR